mgnify:CR=1 FL=1
MRTIAVLRFNLAVFAMTACCIVAMHTAAAGPTESTACDAQEPRRAADPARFPRHGPSSHLGNPLGREDPHYAG